MSEVKKQFVKNSFYSYSTKFIPVVFSFVYTIVLANVLGANDYGLFVYLTALVVGFLNLFGSNLLNEIVTNFTAQSGSKKLFKTILGLQYVLVILVFLGLYFFGEGFLTGLEGSTNYIFLLALVTLFLTPISTTMLALNKGIGKFDRIFVVSIFEHLVNLVFILLFVWYMELGIVGAFYSKFVSLAFSGLIYLAYLRKTHFANKPIEKKVVAKYGFFGALGEFLKQGLNQFEFIIIGIFISPAALGVYYIATKISNIVLGAPSSAFSDVLFPLNSSNFKDKKKIERYSSLSIKGTFITVLIFSILLMLIAYPVLAVLFPAYLTAVTLIPLIVIRQLVRSVGAVKLVLNSINKTGQRTIQRILVVPFGAVILILLVPSYGINGLIITQIIIELFAISIAYILLWKYNNIKIDLVLRRRDIDYFYKSTKELCGFVKEIFTKKV